MNQDLEKILEFDKIRGMIGEYCSSNLGRSLIDDLHPVVNTEQIKYMLDICSELKEIKILKGGLPLGGIKDIRNLMKLAEVSGAILEPNQILDISSISRVAKNLKKFHKKISEEAPLVSEIIDNIISFPELEEEINRCIDPDGAIMDNASPALSRIRKQLVSVRQKIIDQLESILHSPNYRTAIQENVITLRNNRYVIPVKQNYKGSIPGVIQASSTSGVTVFVEPEKTVELNNQMRELADQELAEERRILRELTTKVHDILPELEITVDILAEIDMMNAKASFCLKLDTTKPILNEDGYIDLKKARHPILQMISQEGHKVIPIDLYAGKDFRTLVITGPNTGGKTVALKTAGLLTLMMQSGLHIPAEDESQMSVFTDVFADIGDEQSIEQNLSTFSSHMTRIIGIIKEADYSSLILLDELGAGTEPSEGAALGMAILDYLHSLNSLTIATTHHDSLKAHAHSQEGMENASMAFNLETLSPTYELRIGIPGSSNALKIASKLGLPEEILENAEKYLGSEIMEVADLIANVDNMRRELEEQKRITEEKVRSASRTQQEHEMLLQQLKSKRRELENEAYREAANIIQKSKKLIDDTISELRKEKASEQVIQKARQKISERKKEISRSIRPEKRDIGRKVDAEELKIGDKVYIESLDNFGTLTSLPDSKDTIQVMMNGIKLNLSVSDIRITDKAKKEKSRVTRNFKDTRDSSKSTPGLKNIVKIQRSRKSNVLPSLDLRGARADEALRKTDKYLDDAALAGLESVSIVHGKGTGALRQAVTELLSDHPHVSNFRLGNTNEGGSGVTVVELV
ncbi:endonuclease MutS2 [Candidatus Poribacteria bacterium]|nr:endonuclease MutS2 [Candidatus Poribacteria bacterium]